MNIFVDCNGAVYGDGSKEKPFKKINDAALIAQAGDTVVVAPGIYREWVKPINAGTKESPITYVSSSPRGAVITGAEEVKEWEKYEGTTWVASFDADYFEGVNPFTTRVFGDWLNGGIVAHIGEVYLNDKSLYEVDDLSKVLNPEYNNSAWDRDFSIYTWYAQFDENTGVTKVYANFGEYDPTSECVEVNARTNCFFPLSNHVDYITVKDFVITKAATQWAPPTAFQDGMIGPNWAKGWVIDNCEISNSKCSGISLGKYKQQNNDNKWSKWKYKDGTQTQRDCVMIAQIDGWSKETIGSHTVRNCDIHDCGQTGIVGHLGCVFSLIENNHIHHINNKQNLEGAEIGGIKFHAAIDTIIRNNHFHHCTRGVWLDWQAQGTRVSSNLFHDNCLPYEHLTQEGMNPGLGLGEDLFIEVSHGPTLVDNNILLSDRAVKLPTQGVAFVHNFIAGSITAVGRGVKNGAKFYDSTRYTPYHVPHRTEVTGFMSILHGDVKLYNNVFMQQPLREGIKRLCDPMRDDEWDDGNLISGTTPFEEYQTFEEWNKDFEGYCGQGAASADKYYKPLPVWIGQNAYFNGAKACSKEVNGYVDTDNTISYGLNLNEDGSWEFVSNYIDFLPEESLDMIDSDYLGIAFEAEQRYEGPNGETIVFDTDIYGNNRGQHVCAGPVAVD